MAQPPSQFPANLTYVDHPDIAETFADAMERLIFDGATVRMEFVVNRLDDPKPPHRLAKSIRSAGWSCLWRHYPNSQTNWATS